MTPGVLRTLVPCYFFAVLIGKAFCLKPFHTGARCFQFGDTKISVPLKTRGRHVVDTLLTLC